MSRNINFNVTELIDLDQTFIKGKIIIKSNSMLCNRLSLSLETYMYLCNCPFDKTIELTNPTIKEFIKALWQVKFIKFGSDSEPLASVDVHIIDDIIVIKCNFNIGNNV
jgi:hypothetical protein